MSQMPSNDDTENHIEGTTKDRATNDAAFEPVLSVDHSVDNDLTSANEASAVPLSSDDSMPQEFTFFKKRNVQIKRYWSHLSPMLTPIR